MTRYRHQLPQLEDRMFLTDGGIETTLIFLEGLELPYFASFTLLKSEEGRDALRKYFRTYVSLARREGLALILESATWRANPDWAARLGYDDSSLAEANRKAIRMLEEIRRENEDSAHPIVISGCVGPRGDGYRPGERMTPMAAEAYHAEQINVFAWSGADLVTAITMNYPEEAIGIVRAANAADIPAVIAFTVETDGRLPSGETLEEAIALVDAATPLPPAYYMINCAHPDHFESVLPVGADWTLRIRGLRANASTLSHAELDEAAELDDGNPAELSRRYRELLLSRLPALNVFGGCCGTDHRHVEAMSLECRPIFESRSQSEKQRRTG